MSAGQTVALITSIAPKIVTPIIEDKVDDWLEENITNPDSPPLDRSLSSSSSAAPADMVGDLKSAISTNRTITWNQLSKAANNWAMNFGSGTVTKGTDEISVANAPVGYYAYTGIDTTAVKDHRYLFICYAKATNATAGLYLNINGAIQKTTSASEYTMLGLIATSSSNQSFNYSAQLRCFASTGGAGTVYFKNPKMFDLTMLGLDGIDSVDDFVRTFPDWSSASLNTSGTQRKLTVPEEQALRNIYFYTDAVNVCNLLPSDFVQGAYQTTSLIDTPSSSLYMKRIGFASSYKYKAGSKIYYCVGSNCNIFGRVFANKPGISQSAIQSFTADWVPGQGVWTLDYDGYVTINIRYENDAQITPSDYKYAVILPNDVNGIQNEIAGVGTSPYYGQKIRLDTYNFNVVKIGTDKVSSLSPQGACVYGNSLFQFFSGSKFAVYNLTNNTVSSAFEMGSGVPSLHCNSACFGNKQNSSDAFPLLYVNSYLDDVGKGKCYVQKITESSGSYSTTLIQTITVGFTDQEIWTGTTINPSTLANGNFLVDTVNNRLIAYTTQGFERTRFFLFELPDTSESTVTLSQSDILDYFDIAYIANIQDSCLHNGIIYMTAGTNYGDYDQLLRIYAINLAGRCIVSEIHLEEITLLNNEPEGIDYYNGSLIETDVSGNVNKLTF